MIVIDTNIIVYLMLPTSFTESAEKLYSIDSEWAAPILWKSEFRNVLALYLRRKMINLEQAFQLQETAESMMSHNEFDVSSNQILGLIEKSNCSAYDCEFVALALHLNVALVTQDKKVLQGFPATAISISDYIFSHES